MRISVIGCGRWGSFLAWYLHGLGMDVSLYGRANSEKMIRWKESHTNGHLVLPWKIQLTTNLQEATSCDVLLIAIESQKVFTLMQELQDYQMQNTSIVLCMKGIDTAQCKRLSEIVEENIDTSNRISVWLGPGHVQEFLRGVPNCMVIDGKSEVEKERLIRLFSSDLIRFYYGDDLIGNEIGAAAKNVIGIAAGLLDGFGISALKGALMSRGTREVARLIKAMGGSELSAYGLCHLGDYEATLFSSHSQNRQYGEAVARGNVYQKLAEGHDTVAALVKMKEVYDVELPICDAVYQILYESADPKQVLDGLFGRSLKQEFSFNS